MSGQFEVLDVGLREMAVRFAFALGGIYLHAVSIFEIIGMGNISISNAS